MLKHSLKVFSAASLGPTLSCSLRRQDSRRASTEANKPKWDLMSGVCIERHPIITKAMNALEARFQNVLNQMELEKSMKSDHELRRESEEKEALLRKEGLLDVEIETSVKQTAQDLEDAGVAELAAFKLAPRVTEADEKNIVASLDRKLEKCLVLLVEQKIGNDKFWLPPQGCRLEGESMRQAAERVLRESCGDGLNVRIYGNSPIGFYKYVYPLSVRKERDAKGAKLFYYLAKYINGNVRDSVAHVWQDRDELEKILAPPIHKSLSMFLVRD